MADRNYRNITLPDLAGTGRMDYGDYAIPPSAPQYKTEESPLLSAFLKQMNPKVFSDLENYVAGSVGGGIPGADDSGYRVAGSRSVGDQLNLNEASAFMPMFGGELSATYNPSKGGVVRMPGRDSGRGGDYKIPQEFLGLQFEKKF